jgi:hypothetical protein
MSENGRVLGTQNVVTGGPVAPRLPGSVEFPIPFPNLNNQLEVAQAPNVIFNTDDKWEIYVPSQYEGQTLNESQPFNYNNNLDVRATWWKKVNIVIWCHGSNYAETDLIPNVHVSGADAHEPGPNPPPNELYAFFPDNADATFNITGSTYKIITVSDRVYRFVGWSDMQPVILSTSANPFQWCSMNLQHIHQNIEFNNICLHNEYAAFINGPDVRVRVKTNIDKFNNNQNYKYRLIWEDDTHDESMFKSLVPIPSNPEYVVPDNKIGHQFYLVTYNPNGGGELPYIETYEFKGWFMGSFDGTDLQQYQDMVNSGAFYQTPPSYSPYIWALYTPIVVTAVYMPASDTYTIIYHSGLPLT